MQAWKFQRYHIVLLRFKEVHRELSAQFEMNKQKRYVYITKNSLKHY